MKRVRFLCTAALFCCINFVLYAEFNTFLFYGIPDEVKNSLELVEFNINYNFAVRRIHEYHLYNNSNTPFTVRLGMAYQYDSDVPPDLEFKVNDAATEFELSRVEMPDGGGFPFAYITVVFPPGKTTKLCVNSETGGSQIYNPDKKQFSNYLIKGVPRFTVTLQNYYMVDSEHADLGIEECWIQDIELKGTHNSIISILKENPSLSNEYFTIRKTGANAWNIEFTPKYFSVYPGRTYISVSFGEWGWDELGGLEFNCEEKLAPYQYIFLTDKQLQVIRNAYYARHGYIFKNTALKKMYTDLTKKTFGGINYQENPNFSESMLTEIDRANIATIQRLEAMEFEQ
jgi:hypothetical protein